jgi:hypothetical protein
MLRGKELPTGLFDPEDERTTGKYLPANMAKHARRLNLPCHLCENLKARMKSSVGICGPLA